MGADQFSHRVKRDGRYTYPGEAFTALVQEARYMHGHGGYTGTIGEKSDFLLVKMPADFGTTREVIDFLESAEMEQWDEVRREWRRPDPDDNRLRTVLGEHEFEHWSRTYNDKWGPALCIETDDAWIFCGYASS